jgi:sortase A
MFYFNSVVVAEPPPPLGVVEALPPPSLEENPLPVLEAQPSPPVLAETQEPAGPEPGPSAANDPSPDRSQVDVIGAVIPAPSATPLPSGPQSSAAPADSRPPREASSPAPAPVPAASSAPTRIVAPAIELDGEVVPVGWQQVVQDGQAATVWEVADHAAGWHQNSALPGAGGNVVLSGHHNIKGEIFRYIVDLEPGDSVTLYADNRPYTYTVESRFVVRDSDVPEEQRLENARWIGSFPDERLTLVSCWPYTNNTHRVIVVAKPAR